MMQAIYCNVCETKENILFLKFDIFVARSEDTICEDIDVAMVTDMYNFSFIILEVEFDFLLTHKITFS